MSPGFVEIVYVKMYGTSELVAFCPRLLQYLFWHLGLEKYGRPLACDELSLQVGE